MSVLVLELWQCGWGTTCDESFVLWSGDALVRATLLEIGVEDVDDVEEEGGSVEEEDAGWRRMWLM
ncbi:hypothetical protein AAVH_27083 [Aphelenchoides avenae]|nr:hypothetical protein AAVH_27082 [Aphelenchus avenae]KAH7705698.1 hypothetical protein AAVH_27083 [Aphelenchus avenae]